MKPSAVEAEASGPNSPPGGSPIVRIGVDTGGTFTDCILWDQASGTFALAKVPSRPANPDAAVQEGLAKLLDGRDPRSVDLVGHGTTVATNAVIQGTYARAGMIVTSGCRDVLEIGSQQRERLYALDQPPRPALIPRDRRIEVAGRVTYDGAELEPLDEGAVVDAVTKLLADGVESIAIGGLFGYLHPQHEVRIESIAHSMAPQIHVARSSSVAPELREYPRFATLAVNAALAPLLDRYITRLSTALEEAGFTAGLYVMQSNGGVSTGARSVGEHAHRLVLSGPAAGILGGCHVARLAGVLDVLTLDIGGTSADIGVAVSGVPRSRGAMRLENGLPLQIPSLEVEAIGAGGGSIAWIDAGGALRVGPQSAGADPGPACYGKGGRAATVTDAHVVLGRLDPDNFLGGALTLDPALARGTVANVARLLDCSIEAAASGIIAVTEANMVGAMRRAAAKHGDDLRTLTLVPAGGAGPLHGVALADELGMPRLVVPPNPGLLSALGVLVADLRHDLVATLVEFLDQLDPAVLQAAIAKVSAEARALLLEDDVAPAYQRLEVALDLRYVGQEWTLTVPIEADATIESIDRRFHASHERLYGHSAPGERVEVTAVRIVGLGVLPSPDALVGQASTVARPTGDRDVWFPGPGFVTSSVLDRSALRPGEVVLGPAVIEQLDSTTILPPAWQATAHPSGSLVLQRRSAR